MRLGKPLVSLRAVLVNAMAAGVERSHLDGRLGISLLRSRARVHDSLIAALRSSVPAQVSLAAFVKFLAGDSGSGWT